MGKSKAIEVNSTGENEAEAFENVQRGWFTRNFHLPGMKYYKFKITYECLGRFEGGTDKPVSEEAPDTELLVVGNPPKTAVTAAKGIMADVYEGWGLGKDGKKEKHE